MKDNKTFRALRDFVNVQKLVRHLAHYRALFWQITSITFIVEPPTLHSEQTNRDQGLQNMSLFLPHIHGSHDSAHALCVRTR